jgi:hypothetical protein
MPAGQFRIERVPLGREHVAEPRRYRLVVVPAVEAAADAGLVGDDDERMAGIAKPAERRRHSGRMRTAAGSDR